MKVCHVVPNYYPFYSDPFEYTRKLAAMDIGVSVVSFGKKGEEKKQIIDGVEVRRIPLGTTGRFSLQNTYKFIFSVLDAVAGKRYDLIHVYGFRGCSLLPTLGRGLTRCWLVDVRSGNVTSGSSLRTILMNRLSGLEALLFDSCIAIDRRVGERVLGRRRLFDIVPIGADFNKFRPGQNESLRKRLGIDKEEIVVVFTGVLEPERSPERVLKAFAKALERLSKLKLLIVGEGTVRKQLEVSAKTMGIQDMVHFASYIPYAHIQEYVSAGDIGFAFVPQISQYDLQPPLKTVEFLASGLPTIATKTKGNSLFIRDGENGLLIDDDIGCLAEGILALACDYKLRQKLRDNARGSVREYDYERIVKEKLLPVYERILKKCWHK